MPIKKTGSYQGQSNKLGYGGRSAQLQSELQAKGLPQAEIGGIIGERARAAQAAPGQKNYHGRTVHQSAMKAKMPTNKMIHHSQIK